MELLYWSLRCISLIQHCLLFDSHNFRLEDNESADIKSCLNYYFLMQDTAVATFIVCMCELQ